MTFQRYDVWIRFAKGTPKILSGTITFRQKLNQFASPIPLAIVNAYDISIVDLDNPKVHGRIRKASGEYIFIPKDGSVPKPSPSPTSSRMVYTRSKHR